MYGNSILLVVTEEFSDISAQIFCNIPWQLIIAHNSGPKYYLCGKKILQKKSILEIKNQALLLPVGYFSLAVCDVWLKLSKWLY